VEYTLLLDDAKYLFWDFSTHAALLRNVFLVTCLVRQIFRWWSIEPFEGRPILTVVTVKVWYSESVQGIQCQVPPFPSSSGSQSAIGLSSYYNTSLVSLYPMKYAFGRKILRHL
jgi:hypothetical protein